eukprot:TRINITY_DN49953_c0_g1_i1.p1 TRINITY_DN49953_c0_g1~~TRINITY_DN49953_c0_g1_i1.p1  ORF type:complete len:330 (+),score=30.96 TRINITY_DN49953_c0_g1_i1:26-1015(+)
MSIMSLLLGAHALCFQLAAAFVPAGLPFNEWPMIEAHDSATGYLSSGRLHPINQWAVTQPSDTRAAVTKQLNCGTRAFDLRPLVDRQGHLMMHHGFVSVNHSLRDTLQEMLDWAAEHPNDEDMLVVALSHFSGPNCKSLTESALRSAGIPKIITDCRELRGLTLGQALEMSRLPRGGHLLPVFDCVEENYSPEVSCSGYSKHDDSKVLESDTANGMYTCYTTSSTKRFPVQRMFSYLDNVSQKGPPSSGLLWSMQALWQETTASVLIGELHASSILLDEFRSKLNTQIREAIQNNRFAKMNLIEINNACDGGLELLDTLRSRLASSVIV